MQSKMSSDVTSVRPKIRTKTTEKLIGEPLERRTIRFEDRDGIERYYPALHIKFSHTMVCMKYCRPPIKTMANLAMTGQDFANNSDVQRWLANVNQYEEMLKTLLQLQHNQFWSTLINEPSLQTSLESYLRCAPRDYELYNSLITNQMKTCLKRVYNLVFKLYLRICSTAESKTHFISENTFGNLIYDNYLIDFPKMVELSVLYANTGFQPLLTRMLSNVLRCQPRYDEDLVKGCAHFNEAFRSNEKRLGIDENSIETSDKLSYIQWSELQSIIISITDLSVSVRCLALSVPQIVHHYKKSSIDKTIVEFYNRVFPLLQNELNSRFETSDRKELISEQIQRQVLTARSNIIYTFRDIIRHYFIDKLMDQKLTKQSKFDLMDQFIETLTSASFEKSFIRDYCSQYSVESDLDDLSKDSELTQFQSVDKTRVDYLKSLIQSNASSDPKIMNTFGETKSSKESIQIEGQMNGFAVNMNDTNVELESQIQYIREIIPDLGTGFVEKCLQFYNMDNEKVLNAILEDNLPEPLCSLDRNLQKVSTKQNIAKKLPVSGEASNEVNKHLPQFIPDIIDDRKNIYNNDEFDIFRNKDVDLNRMHLGKKNKQTVSQMDHQMREKIMSLHYMAVEEEENQELLCYDDEYDDTYEDDTIKIDLIADKLMDELQTTDENDGQMTTKGKSYKENHPKKTNFYRQNRNFK